MNISELFNSWGLSPTLIKPVLVLINSIIVWILVLLFKRLIVHKIEATTTRYHTRKFLDYLTFFLILLIIAITYSNKLSGLGVALGVAGAGIAFALQQVIVSFAGWLSILFGRMYTTGDRIQLGGITGDVIDIGVLRTTLMETGQWVDGDIYNGRIVTLSNSFIFKDPVFNYSGDFPYIWDEIKINLQLDSDILLAKEMFQKIAMEITGDDAKASLRSWKDLVIKYMIEDAKTDPLTTIAINQSRAEFTIRYIVGYRKRRTTKDLLFVKILDAINKSNGALKFSNSNNQVVVYASPPEGTDPKTQRTTNT